MRLPPPPPVARAVASTPADRDRVLDVIRAAALAVVVLGHVIMGITYWQGDEVRLGNTLAAYGWTAYATWAVQIMPLFFAAGGAVNRRSYGAAVTRGTPYPQWLFGRVDRLVRPVVLYLAIAAPLAGAITVMIPEQTASRLLALTTQLLWFVGAYVIAVALTPILSSTADRHPALGCAGLLASVAAVDAARLAWGWPAIVGLLNFVTVWSFACLLGMLLDSGKLTGAKAAAIVGAALVTNLVLTGLGWYPVSMVGLPGERFSNMAPPSLALAAHTAALVSLVALAHRPLSRLAERASVWRATVAVNLTAMTLYLWHLPVIIAVLWAEHALGMNRPAAVREPIGAVPGPAFWWWTIPHAVVALGAVALAVRLLWPLEYIRLPFWNSPPRSVPSRRVGLAAASAGVFLIGASTLALAAVGLAGFPLRVMAYAGVPLNALGAIALLLLGAALVRWAGGKADGTADGRMTA